MTSPSRILIDQILPHDLVQRLYTSLGRSSGDATSAEDRYWLSNGRKMSDQSWEKLTVRFKSAASISQISFDMLSVGSYFELWYLNRSGQRLPVLDQSLRQFTGTISSSQIENRWVSFKRNIYPIVAISIEVRIRRVDDGVFNPNDSVSVGMRNTVFKRNIYGREDTAVGLDTGVDSIGNSIQRTVKDWDAAKAVDNNVNTFWKCEPQPDPNAIVCFYLDGRSETGSAQRIDRLWLDPVYAGQSMNIYYSNDDTEGVRKLSKTRLISLDSSVNWSFDDAGLNLKDSDALYEINSIALGQFNLSDPGITFMGTWIPSFDSSSVQPTNITLFTNENQAVATNNFRLVYNVSLRRMEYTSGGITVNSSSISFTSGSAVMFAAVSGPQNRLFVFQSNAYTSQTVNNTPTVHTDKWGQQIQFKTNQGWLRDFVIRQGFEKNNIDAFMASPTIYLTPDPLVSTNGVIPSTLLDNVVYGADFSTGEHGFGGLDYNFFTEKKWVPVFKDWKTYRGFYYFPEPIRAKYVKLEFTELIAESYPIYETGIEVKYQSFPISVIKTSKSLLSERSTTTTVTTNVNSSMRGTIGNDVSTSSTYNNATTRYAPDMEVSVGTGVFSDLPRSFDTSVTNTFKKEVTSSSFSTNESSSSQVNNYVENVSYVQKQVTNTVQVAKDAYYTVVKGDWLIKIAARYGIDWHVIYEMNKDLIKNDRRVGRLPSRPEGWWIFPGQQLRIPGVIMENITQTSTVTERVVSTSLDTITTNVNKNVSTTNTNTLSTNRARFTTTQVHRYELKTATRDAAIAYFTGLREVQLFTVNYVAAEDSPGYTLSGDDFSTLTNAETNFIQLEDLSWKPNSSVAVKTLTNNDAWSSTSPFIKLKSKIVANPLMREVSGISGLSAITTDTGNDAFWSTDIVSWNSATSFWGATRPLGSADVDPSVSFDGEQAMRIIRGATELPTDIAVKTGTFNFPAQLGLTRVTVVYNSNINRGNAGNQYRIEIVDVTNEVTPLFSELVPVAPAGKWNTYTTHYFRPPDARDVYVRFVTTGTENEILHIGNLYTETSSTKLEVSNNNGVNYYDATPSLNDENSAFVFPRPGNKFKFRISSFGPREHIFGASFTPYYLI